MFNAIERQTFIVHLLDYTPIHNEGDRPIEQLHRYMYTEWEEERERLKRERPYRVRHVLRPYYVRWLQRPLRSALDFPAACSGDCNVTLDLVVALFFFLHVSIFQSFALRDDVCRYIISASESYGLHGIHLMLRVLFFIDDSVEIKVEKYSIIELVIFWFHKYF